MPTVIGSHSVASFVNPSNGDALDANVVKGNDNTLRAAYVNHDADPGVHVQSSVLAARPVAGVVGRKWMTTDGGVRLWYDTGSVWEEISYVSLTGTATLSDLNVTNALTVDGTTLVVDAVNNRVGVNTASPGVALDVTGTMRASNGVTVTSGGILVAGNSTVTGNLTATTLKLPGATSGTVTVEAASVAGTWTLTLPTTDGDAGQVLTTDGSGVATWTTVGGQFLDQSITPLDGAPYAVIATDVDKQLVMNSTVDTPIVNFLSTNTGSIATGSRVQLAAFGRFVYLNTTYNPAVVDAFNPNSNGSVYAIAIQSDGKAIIVGSFTQVGGTTRNRIARLNTDGTLDTGYNPDLNGLTVAIAIQSDGKAIIGGGFTTVGGTTRNNVARLNTDGTLDTGYNPDGNGSVNAIAIQSDGKAIIGGAFTTVGGTARNRIARLNTDGTLDTGYDPNANNSVTSIAIQSDGKAIIVGAFTTVGGTTRNRIARLNTDGTLDTGFNPDAGGQVDAIAIQSDGKAVIGGSFTTIGGTTRNFIARLNTDGTLDTGFNPNANGNILAIAIQSDGKAIIGGGFATVGGTTRNNVARLNTDGTLDTGFGNTSANNQVRAVASQSDGKALIGGDFTTVGVTTRNRIARLGDFGVVSGGDTIRTPVALPVPLPRYSVLTFKKIGVNEWCVVDTNNF
jgi:uncharacterized delta-60 repeat protein